MIDRILSSEQQEDVEINIRPNSLDDFIGQADLKANLKIFITASKARQESLDHLLFYGPPGLGKTTLSQIISQELGSNIKFTTGPAITKQGDLAAIISNLETNDILFIDEIHRLPIIVEEVLYSAMEDFKIDIILGEGPTARSLRIDLPKFTLVGATTRYGLLSSPLRDRFGIALQLDFYKVDELVNILMRSAIIFKLKLLPEAAHEIAKRSRGTPRVANRLLRRIRDFLTVVNKKVVDKELANYALSQLGIDSSGLDALDRKYLHSIVKFYNGGPVGIGTIANMLAENKNTIEDIVEPFLIQKGYVARTARGRVISAFGWQYLDLKQKQSQMIYKEE